MRAFALYFNMFSNIDSSLAESMESLELMFCYIWEFSAKPLKIDEFESAYGPDGLWAQLFRKAPNYIRTELLKDPVQKNHYLTVDYWADRQAYERFTLDFRAEYTSLDEVCEDYIEFERHIGDFEVQ